MGRPKLRQGLARMLQKSFRQLCFQGHDQRERAIQQLAQQLRVPPRKVNVVGVGN